MEPALEQELRRAEELVLVTRGRKSGGPHQATVWFAYEDGALWLRTDRTTDWFRNLRRHPRCRVRIGSAELAATYEPVADEPAALRHVVDLFRAKYGVEWVSDWYVERGRAPVRLRLEG